MLKTWFSFSLLISLALVGCGSTGDLNKSSSQLEVGVRAARSELWREALFRFERAVQLDPASPMARNNLAVAYEGVGDFEKARAAYMEALRLDRTNQYIQKNYSRFTEFNARNRKRTLRPGERTDTPSTMAPAGTASPKPPGTVGGTRNAPPAGPSTAPPKPAPTKQPEGKKP